MILTFCIRAPKLKEEKEAPLYSEMQFWKRIREGVFGLGARSGILNSVHEVAADIFKEELVTADKIPYVELSAHFRATTQSAGTGQGLLKCSCNSN